MESVLPNTAVFIDGDWLHYAARRLKRQVDYRHLLDAIRMEYGVETPVHIFLSIIPNNTGHARFQRALASMGYNVETAKRKVKGGRTSVKGLDVSLATKAASLPDHFTKFVLISGDSDFVPLLRELRRSGKSVLVIAIAAAARSLVDAADHRFKNLEALLESLPIKGTSTAPSKSQKALVPPSDIYVRKGDFFEPYLAVRKLFLAAKSSITVVDPYIDDQLLHLVKLISPTVSIRILTTRVSPTDFCIQVKKLRKEGYQITVSITDAFHDRFLGVDSDWWHSGHSFKDLGGKDSLITRVKDPQILQTLAMRVTEQLDGSHELCR